MRFAVSRGIARRALLPAILIGVVVTLRNDVASACASLVGMMVTHFVFVGVFGWKVAPAASRGGAVHPSFRAWRDAVTQASGANKAAR